MRSVFGCLMSLPAAPQTRHRHTYIVPVPVPEGDRTARVVHQSRLDAGQIEQRAHRRSAESRARRDSGRDRLAVSGEIGHTVLGRILRPGRRDHAQDTVLRSAKSAGMKHIRLHQHDVALPQRVAVLLRVHDLGVTGELYRQFRAVAVE